MRIIKYKSASLKIEYGEYLYSRGNCVVVRILEHKNKVFVRKENIVSVFRKKEKSCQ